MAFITVAFFLYVVITALFGFLGCLEISEGNVTPVNIILVVIGFYGAICGVLYLIFTSKTMNTNLFKGDK